MQNKPLEKLDSIALICSAMGNEMLAPTEL